MTTNTPEALDAVVRLNRARLPSFVEAIGRARSARGVASDLGLLIVPFGYTLAGEMFFNGDAPQSSLSANAYVNNAAGTYNVRMYTPSARNPVTHHAITTTFHVFNRAQQIREQRSI